MGGDALRGAAAIFVVLCHAWLGVGPRQAVDDPGHDWGVAARIFDHGIVSVYIFFVLSGYLVGGPFLRAWIEGHEMPDIRLYASRRLRRILPAFWVITALLIVWFGTYGSTKGQVLALFTFQQNQHPGPVDDLMPQGWTLDVEMAYYVALPILAAVAWRAIGVRGTVRQRRIAVLGFLAATFLVSFVLHDHFPGVRSQQRTLLTFWWPLVPGFALAVLETPGRARLAGTGLGRALGAGLMAIGTLGAVYLVAANPSPIATKSFVAEGMTAFGWTAGVLVWQWATAGVPRALRLRPLHAVGRWSYSLYLIHVAIGIELLKHVGHDMNSWALLALTAAVMLVGSTVFAAVMWWLVEEPFLKKRPPRPPWRARVGAPQPQPQPANTLP